MTLTARLAPVVADIRFNAVERMSKGQSGALAEMLRGLATHAWAEALRQLRAEGVQWDPEQPLVMTLETRRYTSQPRRIDADAGAWAVKRVLDGARDARVLVDDGPDYIHEVRLTRPLVLSSWQSSSWGLVAHLEPV